MKLDWTKDVAGKPEEIESRKALVRNSSQVLAILKKVMERKHRDYAELGRPGYEDSAWALRAADANGYQRALREIIDLLTPDKEES